MHRSTFVSRLVAAMTIALLGASGASAETSSWVGRNDGPAEPAPATKRKAEPKTAPVKIIKTVPGTPAVLPAIMPPLPPSSQTAPVAPAAPSVRGRRRQPHRPVPRRPRLVLPPASTRKTPAPSEDAPYEAFDQGRYLTALQLAVKAAELGDPQAHTLAGRIYAEGYGAPRNSGLAAQWYARGAELGDPEAMFALGVMLAEGQGVAKDRDAAGQMFEAAAVRKHALANYNLALLFLKGEGKPENPHRAFCTCSLRRRRASRWRNTIWARSMPPALVSIPMPSRPRSGWARPLPAAAPRRSSTTR